MRHAPRFALDHLSQASAFHLTQSLTGIGPQRDRVPGVPLTAAEIADVEAELRKVTWPTMPEAVRSSVVVIACVLFLMAFLAGADWVLGRWAERLLLGG